MTEVNICDICKNIIEPQASFIAYRIHQFFVFDAFYVKKYELCWRCKEEFEEFRKHKRNHFFKRKRK